MSGQTRNPHTELGRCENGKYKGDIYLLASSIAEPQVRKENFAEYFQSAYSVIVVLTTTMTEHIEMQTGGVSDIETNGQLASHGDETTNNDSRPSGDLTFKRRQIQMMALCIDSESGTFRLTILK